MGFISQAFPSQFEISLIGNTASKPHLSISSLPWKVNGHLQPVQSLPLSALLDPGKLAGKLPVVAQAPGVENGQEELTPLGSSFVWPVGPIPWSQPRGLGSELHVPVSEQGFVSSLGGVGKPPGCAEGRDELRFGASWY